jgi:nuclear pore complex protein Nup155
MSRRLLLRHTPPGCPLSPSLTPLPRPPPRSTSGRIFLGGSDGHVYEVTYLAADRWRQKRCQKVKLTGGLQQYLPSFVPSLLGIRAASAIDKLCVDDERHVLYSLSQSSAIQVG